MRVQVSAALLCSGMQLYISWLHAGVQSSLSQHCMQVIALYMTTISFRCMPSSCYKV